MFSYTSSRRTYSTVFWCDCVDEDIYQLVETRTEDVVQAPPPHLANLSRSLFQNPWTLPDMTPSTSTFTYRPAFSAALNLYLDLHLPDKSHRILCTRSQLRNSPALTCQGRQSRLGPLDLDRGVF
jgi:hypothetical protein